MSNLREVFEGLTLEEKKKVQSTLCKRALSRWEDFCSNKGKITYTDTVVGMRHEVDMDLPNLAYTAAEEEIEVEQVTSGYQEPTVSLQDMDWELPDKIEFAYYSIYNYYRRYGLGQEIDDWLIVNQALSSESDETIIKAVLANAIPRKI